MSDKGFFASICSFFKGLFSSDSDTCCKPETKTTAPAAAKKANDGLTGVERYVGAQSNGGSKLTGVEKYVRRQLSSNKSTTGVEKYIRSKSSSASLTGVARYIQSKA